MKTMIRRPVAGLASQTDDSDLHRPSEAVMRTSSEREPEYDELRKLRERALAGFQELEPRFREMIEKRIPPRLRGKIDVDGVFQNAMSGLLNSLETRKPKSDAELRAWIFKKTWSRWLDELRRWRADSRDVERENPLSARSDVALAGGVGVATDLGLKESVDLIRDALKPVDFQIVELRIVDELSYEELSRFLNLSPESIRKRFTRALLKIRDVVTSPFTSSP